MPKILDYATDLTYQAFGVRPPEPETQGPITFPTKPPSPGTKEFPGMLALGALGWVAVIYWLLTRR